MKKNHLTDYNNKHKDKTANQDIINIITKLSKNKKITCSSLHVAAKKLGKTPYEVGKQADLINIKFIECQLGLYGYDPNGKTFNSNIFIPEELDEKIDEISVNGSITCKECWDIANYLKLKKIDVASACEIKKIKIKQCQIGAF